MTSKSALALYSLFVILFLLQSRLTNWFFDSKKTLVDSKRSELVVAVELLMTENSLVAEVPALARDLVVL